MIYIYILLGMIFWQIITLKFKGDNKVSFIIFGVITTMISIFRYGSGTDFFAYKYHYMMNPDNMKEVIASDSYMEIGYRGIMAIFKKYELSFESFVFMVGLVVMIVFLTVIYRNSKMKLLSLIIFYAVYWQIYVNSAMRQGIAMAIVFIAIYTALKEKKNFKYICLCIVASLFHKSAVIGLLIPIIIKLQKRYFKSIKFNIFIITMSIALFIIDGSKILGSILEELGINFMYESTGANNLAILLKVVILIILLYAYLNGDKENEWDKKMLYVYFYGVFLFIGVSKNPHLSRLVEYIVMIEIILIPNLVYKIKDKLTKLVVMSTFILIMLVVFLKDQKSFIYQGGYTGNGLGAYEYVSVFNRSDIYLYRLVGYFDID